MVVIRGPLRNRAAVDALHTLRKAASAYTRGIVGNRVSRTSNFAGVSTGTSTYNANDELTSEVDNGVTTDYSYDAN